MKHSSTLIVGPWHVRIPSWIAAVARAECRNRAATVRERCSLELPTYDIVTLTVEWCYSLDRQVRAALV